MNTPILTQEWLRQNAVLISFPEIKTHVNHYVGGIAWTISEHLVEKLIDQLEVRNDHFLKASSYKNKYLTTEHGIIIVSQQTFHNKDLITFDGYKILKLEISREQWFDSSSLYIKQLRFASTDNIVQKELDRVVDIQKAEASAKARAAAIKQLRDELTAQKPNDQGYLDLLNRAFNFDHAYDYIDNLEQWRNANDRRKALIEELNGFIENGEDTMGRIISVHMRQY